MNKKLIGEIEDSLEVFSLDANPLFDLAETIDELPEDSGTTMNLSREEVIALRCCVNFTVGVLAGYLQEAQGLQE